MTKKKKKTFFCENINKKITSLEEIDLKNCLVYIK